MKPILLLALQRMRPGFQYVLKFQNYKITSGKNQIKNNFLPL